MENKEIRHSKGNMASYGFGKFVIEMLDMAFVSLGFFFYEYEVGLNVWLVALGYIIFAVWNAINDPLVGYLTNRPFKFTKKWGRRFPLILFGGVLTVISYFLVFMPPRVDPVSGAWIIFGWLVFSTCLFDTFNSIFFVNYVSLFPDKFRTVEERRKATGIGTIVGIFGVALGAIIPPLLYTFGNLGSYMIQAGGIIIIGLIGMCLLIPGSREDRETIDRYLETQDKTERESFFGTLKMVLKQRSFVVFIIAYMLYRGMVISMMASIPFIIGFVLELEAASATLIFVGLLLGALISIPLWVIFAQKTNNNKKTMTLSCIALTVCTALLVIIGWLVVKGNFASYGYLLFIIGIFIWGLALGGYWAMISPVFSDVIDESVGKTGKREEGIFNGFQQFFGRMGIIMQATSFALIHSMTGFVPGATTQSPEAVWGIILHFAVIPMVFMLIGTVIFIVFYNLTPEKAQKNQQKIKEMGI